jgi:hypothetical protein
MNTHSSEDSKDCKKQLIRPDSSFRRAWLLKEEKEEKKDCEGKKKTKR